MNFHGTKKLIKMVSHDPWHGTEKLLSMGFEILGIDLAWFTMTFTFSGLQGRLSLFV